MWNITNKVKVVIEDVAFSDKSSSEYPNARALVWRLFKSKPQPDNIDWFVSRLFSETLFTLTCPFQRLHELWWAFDEKPVVTILTLLFTNFLRLQCLALCIQLYVKCTRAARKVTYRFAKRVLPEKAPDLDPERTRKTSGPHPHPYASHDCSICGQEIGQFQISVEHVYCGEYSHKQCMLEQLRDAKDKCGRCEEPLTREPQIARVGALTYRTRNLTLLRRRTRLTFILLVCLYSALALVSVFLRGYEAASHSLAFINSFVVDLIIVWALLWAEVLIHDFVASCCIKFDDWGWQSPLIAGLAVYWMLQHWRTEPFEYWLMCWDFLFRWPPPAWLQQLNDDSVLRGYTLQVIYHAWDMLREANAIRGAENVVPGWLRRLWRRVSTSIIKI